MKYASVLALMLVAGCGSARPPARGGEGGQGGEEAPGGSTGRDGGGQGGTGGTRTLDAGAPLPDSAVVALDVAAPDVPSSDTGTASGTAPDAAAAADALAPLAACPKPDIDHLEMWRAHAGSLRPAVGGNLLVKEGERYHMKVEFLPGSAWHEIVVPVANALTKKADLSASKGFTITYSATADLWVQLRPLTHPHGGAQHTFKLPATGGMLQELFVPFTASAWGMLLGDPTFPFAEAVKEANFFDFVGPPGMANTVIVRGLRFDGYVPSCT